MAAIAINDLPACHLLDLKAMSAVRGGGAPWVFGWIRPFVSETPSFGRAINFYQVNNIFIADQVNNQIQVIDINNSAPNASISVAPAESAVNFRQA